MLRLLAERDFDDREGYLLAHRRQTIHRLGEDFVYPNYLRLTVAALADLDAAELQRAGG